MTAAGLWTRIIVGGTLAIALPLTLDVPPPNELRAPPALGLALGLAAGVGLYAVVARRRLDAVASLTVVRMAFIVGWATVEEVVWRWLVLGGLALAVPAGAALVISAVAFACAHPRGRRGHFLAGATFGGLYLLTGTLLASVAAHAAYNHLVAASLQSTRAEPRTG